VKTNDQYTDRITKFITALPQRNLQRNYPTNGACHVFIWFTCDYQCN